MSNKNQSNNLSEYGSLLKEVIYGDNPLYSDKKFRIQKIILTLNCNLLIFLVYLLLRIQSQSFTKPFAFLLGDDRLFSLLVTIFPILILNAFVFSTWYYYKLTGKLFIKDFKEQLNLIRLKGSLATLISLIPIALIELIMLLY